MRLRLTLALTAHRGRPIAGPHCIRRTGFGSAFRGRLSVSRNDDFEGRLDRPARRDRRRGFCRRLGGFFGGRDRVCVLRLLPATSYESYHACDDQNFQSIHAEPSLVVLMTKRLHPQLRSPPRWICMGECGWAHKTLAMRRCQHDAFVRRRALASHQLLASRQPLRPPQTRTLRVLAGQIGERRTA